MRKENLSVPYPDEEMIRIEIKKITEKGVRKKESFPKFLLGMYKQFGLRMLFVERFQLIILFLGLMSLSVLMYQVAGRATVETTLYSFFVFFSPILFFSLSLYSYSYRYIHGTSEVEQACKYSIYQLTAFKLFLFSILSVLMNCLTILLLSVKWEGIEFLHLFMVANTSLFLFSSTSLYILMKFHFSKMGVVISMGWPIGNGLLAMIFSSEYEELVSNLPILVYPIVLFGSVLFFWQLLKKMIDPTILFEKV